MPAKSGDTGDMVSGARVGVGWRVAVGASGELVPVNIAGCPVTPFWIGKNGS